jgi:hypothetical protein
MNRKRNIRIATTMVIVITGFLFFQWAIAGNLDPVAGPSEPGSAMYTLTDIYNRLYDNTLGTKRSGAFVDPSAAPGATGYTLDQIYNIAIPTQVPKTGQTTSYATGDDGDLQKGIAPPVSRFADNGDGTVTDNLTGLIWLKNANCFNALAWPSALTAVNTLQTGQCGLSDGSAAGDWRLPNIKELLSLIDYGHNNPSLPAGWSTVFTGVQYPLYYVDTSGGTVTLTAGAGYWTSTAQQGSSSYKWGVNMYYGQPVLIAGDTYGESYYTWPVRGGR